MGPEHIESVTAASAAITLWRRLSRGVVGSPHHEGLEVAGEARHGQHGVLLRLVLDG